MGESQADTDWVGIGWGCRGDALALRSDSILQHHAADVVVGQLVHYHRRTALDLNLFAAVRLDDVLPRAPGFARLLDSGFDIRLRLCVAWSAPVSQMDLLVE